MTLQYVITYKNIFKKVELYALHSHHCHCRSLTKSGVIYGNQQYHQKTKYPQNNGYPI